MKALQKHLLPCIGAHPKTIDRFMDLGVVDSSFERKLARSRFLASLSMPWINREEKKFQKELKSIDLPESPVFIVGHWRTGTTLLHNLMSMHPEFSYFDYWQGFFPHCCLVKHPLKPIFRRIIPSRRPMDRMKISLELPQEDDIVTLHSGGESFYAVHYFPRQINELWERQKLAAHQDRWIEDLKWQMKKAMYRKERPQFLSKNPVNSIRIPTILEHFPKARFIYLQRSPEEVYMSIKRLYKTVLPITSLQSYDLDSLYLAALNIQKDLISTWQEQSRAIPPEQIWRLEFSEFVSDIKGNLLTLMEAIGVEESASFERAMDDYLQENRSYKHSEYKEAELNAAEKGVLKEIEALQAKEISN